MRMCQIKLGLQVFPCLWFGFIGPAAVASSHDEPFPQGGGFSIAPILLIQCIHSSVAVMRVWNLAKWCGSTQYRKSTLSFSYVVPFYVVYKQSFTRRVERLQTP